MGASSSPNEAGTVAVHGSIDLLGNRVCAMLPNHVVNSLALSVPLFSSALDRRPSQSSCLSAKVTPLAGARLRKLSAEPYINVVPRARAAWGKAITSLARSASKWNCAADRRGSFLHASSRQQSIVSLRYAEFRVADSDRSIDRSSRSGNEERACLCT